MGGRTERGAGHRWSATRRHPPPDSHRVPYDSRPFCTVCLRSAALPPTPPQVIPADVRAQIESQRFAPLRKVVWRSSALDFSSDAHRGGDEDRRSTTPLRGAEGSARRACAEGGGHHRVADGVDGVADRRAARAVCLEPQGPGAADAGRGGSGVAGGGLFGDAAGRAPGDVAGARGAGRRGKGAAAGMVARRGAGAARASRSGRGRGRGCGVVARTQPPTAAGPRVRADGGGRWGTGRSGGGGPRGAGGARAGAGSAGGVRAGAVECGGGGAARSV